jgi:protein tyrosine/serine phosphatase
MRPWVSALLGVAICAGVVLSAVGYNSRTSVQYRGFRVVEPGKLYRSGQMPPEGFERVAREFGIQTVISLRDTKDAAGVPEDQAEADFCRANGLAFHRLPPADWSPVNGVIPGDKNIAEFLRILDDPATRRPVLVHCFAGIHRTGAHVSVYRMEYDRWTAEEAIDELRSMGTPRTTFADNLLDYLRSYTPRHRPSPAAVPSVGTAGLPR